MLRVSRCTAFLELGHGRHHVSDGIYLEKQTNQNGGCFKYKTHFVLATEDDLSMLIDEAGSKEYKRRNILCRKLNENVCFERWCANYRNNE